MHSYTYVSRLWEPEKWLTVKLTSCVTAVKSFRQISLFDGEPDFILSHCVHASPAKSGIYSSRWNFWERRVFADHPAGARTAKLSFVVAVVTEFFADRRRGQNEKILRITPHVVRKSVSYFHRKKESRTLSLAKFYCNTTKYHAAHKEINQSCKMNE